MTHGLKKIQPCTAVVLEGGYSLEALEVSTEAVVRTLQKHPDDDYGFNQLLKELNVPEEMANY
jgi:acetoin utilization deacetylase AcuC-like enzyme